MPENREEKRPLKHETEWIWIVPFYYLLYIHSSLVMRHTKKHEKQTDGQIKSNIIAPDKALFQLKAEIIF